MSFKHTKFTDSATMRSLERVAQEKGWIQNDPIKKTATAPREIDLTPSANLMENILKLTSGLRQSGFDKYADQVENLFVAYKQADKNYDISNEKGEDLIEAAHPEGGHQMENVEGDAYVEDILEKHLKMLDVADESPKGKLASSKSVLDAVKVALGAPPLGFQEVNLPSAPSSFGRLMNFLGKGTKLELAGEGGEVAAGGAGGAAEVGAGGAAAYTGAGAMAAGGAAILAGAIAGGLVGNALFEHYYDVTNLAKAGQRVLEELKDVESDLSPKAYTYMTDFSNIIPQIEELYSKISETQKSPTASNVSALKKLNDLIYQSRKLAGSIWSFAQNKKDSQFLGALRDFGDVVAAASNYMSVAAKINAVIEEFFTQASQVVAQHVQQKTQQKAVETGGSASEGLMQQYQDVLATISKYSAAITARQQSNTQPVLTYLNKIAVYVKEQQAMFNKVAPANRDVSVASYQARLEKAKALLDGLKNKQGL